MIARRSSTAASTVSPAPATIRKPRASRKPKSPKKPERKLTTRERRLKEARENMSELKGCVRNPDGSISYYSHDEPDVDVEFVSEDKSLMKIGGTVYFIGAPAEDAPYEYNGEFRECPLCGGHDIALEQGVLSHVVCRSCGCSTGGFGQPWWAVRMWNTRPADKKSIDITNGFKVFDDIFAFCDAVDDGAIAIRKRKYTRRQPRDLEGWEQVEFSFMENM